MTRTRRKWSCLFLIMSLLIVGMVGCSTKEDAMKDNENQEQSEVLDETETDADGEAGTADSEEEEFVATGNGIEIPDVVIEPYHVPENEALKFVADMKIGWNLGNTFDSYTDAALDDELKSETLWVSTATTEEMIVAIKDAGFNTLRLPVTWHTHLVDDNYTISKVWLGRIKEVVDYGIDNGMYVILNIHHDNNEEFLYPDSAHMEQSTKYVSAIWTQLAAYFADYDEHLIFEAMNEPRLVGTNYEWWLNVGAEECKDAVACINSLNQTFVDAVRAGGGNNATRYLMVPGYCASADGALNDGFVLPTDSQENKLIVSVHAYTPYNFALQSPKESGSISHFDADDANSTRDIVTFMDKLYNKFISQGIPVVIGEFGAQNKSLNTQDRVDYGAYYIAAARARGITCAWWDNNAFTGNGENFGLYYRMGGYFIFQDIVTAMMKYAE